jgi:hypothetical protein
MLISFTGRLVDFVSALEVKHQVGVEVMGAPNTHVVTHSVTSCYATAELGTCTR